MMLLRLSTLATGRTGVRPETAQAYAGSAQRPGITPVVHEYGSLGCSGDLAPLAHVALALMGEGSVRDGRRRLLPAAEALAGTGIEPVELAEKEGLALINGTDGMLGMLVLALHDLDALLQAADIAAAHERRGAARHRPRLRRRPAARCARIPARRVGAANMRALLAGSAIVASHRGTTATRVQDAYSLRCAPQVAGAARDTAGARRDGRRPRAGQRVDNPVVTLDGRVESNGNFHGAPGRPTCWTSWPSRSPTWLASPSAAPTGCSTWPAATASAVPRRRPGRGLRAHDRAVHPGRDRLRAQAARRAASVDSIPSRRCRRTTSRWAGRRRASCAGPSTG